MTLIALGAAVQQVAATWDLEAPSYDLPAYSDNQCTDEQQSGFDWSGLDLGGFSSYGGFDFSGFECTDSFSKRDLLKKRTFGFDSSKCITGTVPYGSGSYTGGPSISYGDGFSINKFQVQTDRLTDVTFYYGMQDGSTCTSTHNCSPEGTYVSNDQCSGAKTVQWEIPDYETDSSDCNIGIYKMSFYCAGEQPPPAYSSIPYKPSITENPYEAPSGYIPGYTSEYVPPAQYTSEYVPPAQYTSEYTPPQYNSEYTPPAKYNSEYTPPPKYNSEYTPPAQYTTPPSYSSVYVPPPDYSAPQYSKGNGYPPSYSAPSSGYSPPNDYTPASDAVCPEAVAKCMNTWNFNTGCKDNADYSCYCQHADFTKKVIDCVDAHLDDDSEKTAAMSCMAGICAPYIRKNPGIITNVPESITICPEPTMTGDHKVEHNKSKYPGSVIKMEYASTVPCDGEACGGRQVEVKTITTEVTVPQVHFAKATGGGSKGAKLVVGQPAPVLAEPTGYSGSTTLSPFPSNGTASTVPAPTSAPAPTGAAIKVTAGSVGTFLIGGVAMFLF